MIAAGRSKPVKNRQAARRAPTECRVRIFVMLYRVAQRYCGPFAARRSGPQSRPAQSKISKAAPVPTTTPAPASEPVPKPQSRGQRKSVSRRPCKAAPAARRSQSAQPAEAGACTLVLIGKEFMSINTHGIISLQIYPCGPSYNPAALITGFGTHAAAGWPGANVKLPAAARHGLPTN